MEAKENSLRITQETYKEASQKESEITEQASVERRRTQPEATQPDVRPARKANVNDKTQRE
jgi:hypothetical protein